MTAPTESRNGGHPEGHPGGTRPLPDPNTRLPVDPETGQPLGPMAQPGYYPGFSTLGQQAFWDAATRRVVLDRVHNVPPLRFFQGEEVKLAAAIVDRIMPQDDRDAEHRIPVLNGVDCRLHEQRLDGYRFADMPPEDEAYHLGLKGIEAIAQHLFGRSFVDLEPLQQDDVLWTLHQANPPAGQEYWDQVPVDRFWTLLVQDCVDAYYAHPYAWDEVGFGGPAYPRGYFRLERGQPEPWEVEEQRYQWQAPPTSSSGTFKPLGGRAEHHGQEGTH